MKIEEEILAVWAATSIDIEGIAHEVRKGDDIDHDTLEVLLLSLSTLIDKRFERILESIRKGDHHEKIQWRVK